MKSREICVWLDERWYDALSRHLKDETVEDKLGDYLDQLINELVPEQEYSRISQELWQEDRQARQELEAARKFAIFRIRESGQDRCLQVERPLEFLDAARLLRSIPHRRAGEKEALPLAAGVGDAPALQQVNEGQGAVVVAVEHGGGLRAVRRRLGQIVGLLPEVVEIHVAHRLPLGTAGPHVLGVAAAVALDEGVRLLHDGPGGAVVGLHQQHLPLRVDRSGSLMAPWDWTKRRWNPSPPAKP